MAHLGIPATQITPAQLGPQHLAGSRLAQAVGGAERQTAIRGVQIGRQIAGERETAIRREQTRERKRRRQSELFSLGGAVAGLLIPGAGPILGAARLGAAALGTRVGAGIGTAISGREPGQLIQQLPGLAGALQERVSFLGTQQAQQPQRPRQRAGFRPNLPEPAATLGAPTRLTPFTRQGGLR